jgi:hypothetical protein
MKVFIGILLYIGVHLIGFTRCAAYWDRNIKTPFHPAVFNAMSVIRFSQIIRYFKVSDAYEETLQDMQGEDW